MKQEGDIISFGCAEFDKDWLRHIFDLLETNAYKSIDYNWRLKNRKISSIKLDSGVEITVEDLKNIVNNLE